MALPLSQVRTVAQFVGRVLVAFPAESLIAEDLEKEFGSVLSYVGCGVFRIEAAALTLALPRDSAMIRAMVRE